jgi:hypothetical protein
VPEGDVAWSGEHVEVRYRRADGVFAETTLARVSLDLLIGGLPVREFRWYRGRQFYSGWYASSTTQGLVAYESRLELARIMLADFDPAVVGIAAQPFQLIGEDGGRTRRHVPDLLLLHESGAVTVVDVKPAHRLDDPPVAAVFAWTQRVVACRGWAFEVWSGADDTLLDNVRFLAGYRRRAVVCERLLAVAVDLAASCGTLGELEHRLRAHAEPELVRPVVLHLIWTGALTADLHGGPLGVSTPLAVGASR